MKGRPLRIGLTGNIGSGKSTVARLLVQKGAALIDADALARAATDDPGVLSAIAQSLGADLIKDGRLDRAATARRVFNNPQARKTLNGIVHPWVRLKTAERLRELEQSPKPPPLILLDIPLLYENGLEQGLDAVIVVNAPLDTRIKRVSKRSGLDKEEIKARNEAQMPLAEKLAKADYVVDNAGDFSALKKQLDALWCELLGITN